jgi:hypothetical protein
MEIRNLHRGEVEDFEAALKEHGRRVEEFDLSAMPSELDSLPGISALRGSVMIQHRKTGVQKTYNTGHGTSWVVDFSDDLRAGFFG